MINRSMRKREKSRNRTLMRASVTSLTFSSLIASGSRSCAIRSPILKLTAGKQDEAQVCPKKTVFSGHSCFRFCRQKHFGSETRSPCSRSMALSSTCRVAIRRGSLKELAQHVKQNFSTGRTLRLKCCSYKGLGRVDTFKATSFIG